MIVVIDVVSVVAMVMKVAVVAVGSAKRDVHMQLRKRCHRNIKH
jgi:hypothetical protein